MPTFMKCARNFTLRSLSGHVITFKADEPTLVPDPCIDEALAVNIIPCEGKYAPEKGESSPRTMRVAAMPAELREALLLHAIDELYREGETKDFDGGGKPKAYSISGRAGLDISATERTKLWDKYRDLKADNADLPRPRNFELVADAQRMSSKADLVAYGADLGVPAEDMRGCTLREIKGMVIQAAIKFDTPKTAKHKVEKVLAPGESALDED